MLKQFMPYVSTDLFLIYRHLYTSLPWSRIILIVMDGAILLTPLVTTLADGLMTWLSLILIRILQYLRTAITSVLPLVRPSLTSEMLSGTAAHQLLNAGLHQHKQNKNRTELVQQW